jgi:hypothetical protein
VYKGESSYKIEDTWNIGWVIPTCFGIGAFFGVLWIFVFGPCAKRNVEKWMAAKNFLKEKKIANDFKATAGKDEDDFKVL